jgi:hypothetical protein
MLRGATNLTVAEPGPGRTNRNSGHIRYAPTTVPRQEIWVGALSHRCARWNGCTVAPAEGGPRALQPKPPRVCGLHQLAWTG